MVEDNVFLIYHLRLYRCIGQELYLATLSGELYEALHRKGEGSDDDATLSERSRVHHLALYTLYLMMSRDE